MLLLVFVFKYDTPPFLKQKGKIHDLNVFMGHIYHPTQVQKRIDELADTGNDTSRNDQQVSYGQVFCNPQYSRATFVGCSLAVFQQLTGINVVIFYSNTIFKNAGYAPATITGLIGIVNFLTTFGGLVLLSLFGRRSVSIVCSALMSLVLIALGVFSIID